MPEEMGGPYVQIAAFCQTALLEHGGNLSMIRVIDRYPVVVQPGKDGIPSPPPVVHLTLVVVLKAGFFKGTGNVTIRPTSYSESVTNQIPAARFPVFFEGDERGVQIVIPMAMTLEEGLYWFEILFEEMMLTKVPLRMMRHAGPTLQTGTAPG
jgi:hypothetical protein